MENRKAQKVAAAFLFGAVMGGVIALLYAPKSGKETRKDISDEINSYLKKASDTKDKIITKAKRFSNDMIHQTEKVYADVQNFKAGKYANTAEKIEGEISKLRNAIKSAMESYRDTKKARKFFPDEDKYFFTDFAEYLFDEEDEAPPKFESMKKRSD